MIFLFSYSCNHYSKPVEKKLTNNAIQKPNLLIGEWGIYATISKGVKSTCNVCPKISFDNDQTAMVIFPSGDKGNLKWTVCDKKLILTIIDKTNIGEIFPDSQYEMTFTQKKDFIELELKQPEKKYSEILRR